MSQLKEAYTSLVKLAAYDARLDKIECVLDNIPLTGVLENSLTIRCTGNVLYKYFDKLRPDLTVLNKHKELEEHTQRWYKAISKHMRLEKCLNEALRGQPRTTLQLPTSVEELLCTFLTVNEANCYRTISNMKGNLYLHVEESGIQAQRRILNLIETEIETAEEKYHLILICDASSEVYSNNTDVIHTRIFSCWCSLEMRYPCAAEPEDDWRFGFKHAVTALEMKAKYAATAVSLSIPYHDTDTRKLPPASLLGVEDEINTNTILNTILILRFDKCLEAKVTAEEVRALREIYIPQSKLFEPDKLDSSIFVPCEPRTFLFSRQVSKFTELVWKLKAIQSIEHIWIYPFLPTLLLLKLIKLLSGAYVIPTKEQWFYDVFPLDHFRIKKISLAFSVDVVRFSEEILKELCSALPKLKKLESVVVHSANIAEQNILLRSFKKCKHLKEVILVNCTTNEHMVEFVNSKMLRVGGDIAVFQRLTNRYPDSLSIHTEEQNDALAHDLASRFNTITELSLIGWFLGETADSEVEWLNVLRQLQTRKLRIDRGYLTSAKLTGSEVLSTLLHLDLDALGLNDGILNLLKQVKKVGVMKSLELCNVEKQIPAKRVRLRGHDTVRETGEFVLQELKHQIAESSHLQKLVFLTSEVWELEIMDFLRGLQCSETICSLRFGKIKEGIPEELKRIQVNILQRSPHLKFIHLFDGFYYPRSG